MAVQTSKWRILAGILALSNSRARRSAWLIGAALAVQPLVLLALPIILAVLEPGRLAGYLARAAVPAVLLLGAAATANWKATVRAVTSQRPTGRPPITPLRGRLWPRMWAAERSPPVLAGHSPSF